MTDFATDPAEIRSRVAQACRVLGLLEITSGTVGHASARLSGTPNIAVRGRGPAESGVRYTTANDIIDVDPEGKRIGDGKDGYNVPLEIYIHTELYRRRPEVNAVIHMHPPAVVLLTITKMPLRPIYGAYDPQSLNLVLGGIPMFEQSILIRTPALGKSLAETMGNRPVCLMRGHGITTAANSVEEAALVAIHLNTIARMTYDAHLLGSPVPISLEEQEAFRSLKLDEGYGDPEAGIPSGRAASLWRYYVRLAEDRSR